MLRRFNLKPFREYFSSSSVGGIVLISCVTVSLLIANLPLGIPFENFLNSTVGWKNEWVDLEFTLLHWINDGLMAVFFLLVGLEIKREILEGELSSPQKASLPIIAAFGGALLPAVIFYLLNRNEPTAAGWGIPMATDIAFALAALSLLGKRVPASLKVFLAALAIVDDLIAIGVIALFYSSDIHWNYLLLAGGVLLLLLLFNRLRLKNIGFYIVPGLFIWYFIHHSGIHATIAGVLVALTLPLRAGTEASPLERLEHFLTKPVNFFIVPLFALANTNIRFEPAMMNGLLEPLGIGIISGLFAGKTLGIFISTRLAVRLKIGKLPRNAGWKHIIGLGMLAGIGFTMSVFISLLSFDDPVLIAEAKLAILIASVLAALAGCLFMATLQQKTK
ncbi:Na+/H+ antiporter NhaA [Niabella ginsenosidivorans]|uniref:Na(+)/H(+) antiporter NhaA n=1 Tax=Niabella ginsenosidivorans TaxID=1176587 RepID=A0A1A9I2J9_9BACT|nr:Na+/H+ antiporter NhaA [Niabella ginsenosidivorans]ANH80804.1 Na+/H+ antiporter NhaA [Niabella ginsenosidivorans]